MAELLEAPVSGVMSRRVRVNERALRLNAPMVRAVLDGSKTQARMVVKPAPDPDQELALVVGSTGFHYVMDQTPINYPHIRRIRWESPFGQPGDRLWIREKCRAFASASGPYSVLYIADAEDRPINGDQHAEWVDLHAYGGGLGKDVPCIHMPRWASRITLKVTGLRLQRLQDISEADAIAEGAIETDGQWWTHDQSDPITGNDPVESYRRLWESINGLGSWEDNPWVWVSDFKRIKEDGAV